MAEQQPDQPDVEPQEPADDGPQEAPKGTSGRKSFANLRRTLTDAELRSPAVQRMLIDEIERLDLERTDLLAFRGKFHEADKKSAVFEEKFNTKISIEVLHVACITVGAAALGYAPSIWQSQPTGWICAVFGVILVIAGIVAKAVKP